MFNRFMAALQDGTSWVLENPLVLGIALISGLAYMVLAASSSQPQTDPAVIKALWIASFVAIGLAACVAEGIGSSWIGIVVCAGIGAELIVAYFKMNASGLHATLLLGLMLILTTATTLLDWRRSSTREERKRETAIVLSVGSAIPVVVYHNYWSLTSWGFALAFIWAIWYVKVWQQTSDYQVIRTP